MSIAALPNNMNMEQSTLRVKDSVFDSQNLWKNIKFSAVLGYHSLVKGINQISGDCVWFPISDGAASVQLTVNYNLPLAFVCFMKHQHQDITLW